ncbi:MAG TPA: ABC transporter ATP-binding protein [Rhizomicrobium sp.]|nr:ABC transporter ATP-binding protein [Rhizomicrobium sp.]
MMMIEIRDLVFEYPGHRALCGVSLSIAAGSITALVGPNGAGKTTLLRCMAALETPYAGHVAIEGLDTRDAPRAIHARLGYLPDFFGLYDALSVRRCLHYAARAHGIAPHEAAGAAQAAAARVGLADRMEQAAGALSRGLRQRLAIAQAIVHRPAVLLLDEPAAGLDPQARRDLSELLLSLRAGGMTLVVSSHILAELEDYSDRMVIVDHGRIAGGQSIALKAGTHLRIRLAAARGDLKDFLSGQGLTVAEASADHALVTMAGGPPQKAALLAALIQAGFAVMEFSEDTRALEDVYFEQVKSQVESKGAAP